ncbi:MAG: FHA domain-containing protein [Deltaproteobacteria bacterium]|nr:FHA domain-containing protein [Deltaproteobacteria bacterium]
MPAFVICTLSEPPRKVVVDGPPVRVGRDASNEIILTGRSVSREHAMFLTDGNGRWLVSCVSDTNPIVVNGALVTAGAPVGEGSEILVGTDALIVVSENAFTANAYMGAKRAFEKTSCPNCNWSGLVSSTRRISMCPRCARPIDAATRHLPDNEKAQPALGGPAPGLLGSTAPGLRSTGPGLGTTGPRAEEEQDATHMIDPAAMMGMMNRMRVAQRSRLERIDGKDDERQSLQLAIDGKVTLGKTPDASFKLHGMLVFGSLKIYWQKDRYVAESALSFPSMRINGSSQKLANLTNGDVLEVGSNRFRFVVG